VIAWVQTAFGGPEVRGLSEAPAPRAAASEVIVRVAAAALNRLDVLQRAEVVVPGFTLPHVAGMDVAGEVVEAGSAEGADLVGRSVVVDPVVSCGHCVWCDADTPTYCADFATIGSTRWGGFAEFVLVPARNCTVIDVALDDTDGFVEAASIPVAGVTAWRGLVSAGRIQPGETVVIPGAGSGLGVAGIQIAKLHGAHVIALAGSADKVAPATDLGADDVIVRTDGDWVEQARELTDGLGADLVWDHVGGRFLTQALQATRTGGRVVLSGTTDGLRSDLYLPDLYQPGRSIIGHGSYGRKDMADVTAAYADGRIRPVIDSVWGFEELPKAEAKLECGDFFGKIVLRGPGRGAAA